MSLSLFLLSLSPPLSLSLRDAKQRETIFINPRRTVYAKAIIVV